MAASGGRSLLPLHVLLVLLLITSTSLRARAVTTREGRPNDLNDTQIQDQLIQYIHDSVSASINSDDYYGPGPVTAMLTEVSNGIRIHSRLILYNTGACMGQGLGEIFGYDLAQAFFNNMLSYVVGQIRSGFGYGVVVEGANDPNLLQEGMSAQFYYWVETVGQDDNGASTPNTGEADGPSDNNPNRNDELSLNVTRTGRSFNKADTSTYLRNNINNTYWVQPPPRSHSTRLDNIRNNNTTLYNTLRSNKTRLRKNTLAAQEDEEDPKDCPPYNYALFLSNYDLNVLGSSAYSDGFPDLIYSPNELYYLRMQDDCNLVLYYFSPGTGKSKPLWACGAACYNQGTNCFARLNLDGTFAVYDGSGENLWFTPTQCSSGPGCWSDTYLAMQDDGNLVLYLMDTNYPIWATNTQS